MSTISAGTTSTTTLIHSGDTTGSLVLKTNDTGSGGTTAVTIGTDQSFNFSATGQRITGDFSNATVANRVMFQTSTTNGNTVINLIPNGTGTVCAFGMDTDPALTNSSTGSFNLVASTDVRLTAGIRGTGTYLPMTFYTGGSERMRIDTSGNVGIGTSSPGAKLEVKGASATAGQLSIHDGTGDTTVSGVTAASLLFQARDTSVRTIAEIDAVNTTTNGTGGAMVFQTRISDTLAERMRIDSSGNVGIATTTTTRAKLNIDTDGTNTSAGYGLALTNTAGGGATWTLQCGDQGVNNGAFTIRQTGISGTTWFKIEATTGYITVQGVYNLTTASAANVFVGTGGDLRRSTSSLKYKTDVQDATYGLAEVMVLRPVTYKGKNDGDTIFGGLIAEEVDAAGLTEFVQYADDGTPDALAYGNMVSLCIKAIQEQQALIQQLQADIATLKGTP